jgi:ubiquitin-protein ligase
MKSRRLRPSRPSRRSIRSSRRSRRIQYRYRQRGGNKILVKQIDDFAASKTHPGIYYVMDEANVNHGYALIIGPRYPVQTDVEKKNAKYPYEECLFFFEVTFPSDYPARPPRVIFMNSSLDPQNIRIHPNLYQSGLGGDSGKVCLSILGTWAGPGWKPTMTLESTLRDIQSLLGPNPIHNEPGLHFESENDESLSYNHIVHHKSIEFSYNIFRMVLADYRLETAARNAARAARPAAGGAGAPPVENNDVEFESALPPFIQPFYNELKQRMWSSIQFYIQSKLDVIVAMHTVDPPGVGIVLANGNIHHKPKLVNYSALLEQIQAFRLEIPHELRKAAAIENSSVLAALDAARAKAAPAPVFTLGRELLTAAGGAGGAAGGAGGASVSTAAEIVESIPMTKEEVAAERVRMAAEREKMSAMRVELLKRLRNMGQNNTSNFIKNMNTVALKKYINDLNDLNEGEEELLFQDENANGNWNGNGNVGGNGNGNGNH